MTGLLAGIRVVDLADEQGAFAGKLLAGIGADVVKVEPPGGAALRAIPPFLAGVPAPEGSLFHWFYDAGKRGVTLDWRRAAGRDVLERLLAGADVLIETEPPGALRADALRAVSPRLIVASITPFGQRGPRAGWSASDTVAQALGGMMFVNGHAGGAPLRSLGLQAYHQAGVFAAIGVVSALLARARTGRGQIVDVSLQASVTGSLEHVPGLFHQMGVVPGRQGTLHWTRFFRVGRCRDGWVMHCTVGDWTSLAEWVKADGMGAALEDPAWENVFHRRDHAERLFDVLDAWGARYTVAELMEGAQLRRIPYAAVRPPEALLDDPQLAARGWFVPLEHPGLGRTVPHPGGPFRPGAAPWRVARPPRLGEHNADVLGALGVDAATLAGAT